MEKDIIVYLKPPLSLDITRPLFINGAKKRKLEVYKHWIEDKNHYMWGIDTRALNEIKEETI